MALCRITLVHPFSRRGICQSESVAHIQRSLCGMEDWQSLCTVVRLEASERKNGKLSRPRYARTEAGFSAVKRRGHA
jgi:hypothetical protein